MNCTAYLLYAVKGVTGLEGSYDYADMVIWVNRLITESNIIPLLFFIESASVELFRFTDFKNRSRN